jgi:hypothetical protein
MTNDEREAHNWDNMLEWRGAVRSTLNALEKTDDKHDESLRRLEDLCHKFPRELDQFKAEIRALITASIAEAQDSNRDAMARLQECLNVIDKGCEGFATKEDIKGYVTKEDVKEIIKGKFHLLPWKILAAVAALLAAYEGLQGFGVF